MAAMHPPMATLRLYADTLDPALITSILSVKPDLAAKAGEGLAERADRTRVPAKTGTWYITTRRHVSESDPAKHLFWVLRLVAPKFDALKEAVPSLRASFSLLVHDGGFEAKSLPAGLLADVLSIGDLEIEVPERAMDIVLDSGNAGQYLVP